MMRSMQTERQTQYQARLVLAAYFLCFVVLCVAAAVPDMRRETVATVLLLHCAVVLLGVLWNTCKTHTFYIYTFEHGYDNAELWYKVYDAVQLCVGIGVLTTSCDRTTWFAWSVATVGCFLSAYKFTYLIKTTKDTYEETGQGTNTSMSKQDMLQRWNLYAFILHTASATFMAPFIRRPLRCMGYDEWLGAATWTTTKWVGENNNTNVNCATEPCKITRCTRKVGAGVPLESLTFGFHMGSALAHLFFVWHPDYFTTVQRSGNPWRWVEYSITAPLMIVVIMSSSGFTDVWSLTSAACLTSITQAFGWLIEKHISETRFNEDNDDENHVDICCCKLPVPDHLWKLFALGSCCAAPPWIALFTIWGVNINSHDADVPWYVTAIIISLFLLFMSFAAVMVARIKAFKGTIQKSWLNRIADWRSDSEDFAHNNIEAEKCYIVLSFVSKLCLAWLLWAGAFRRSVNDLQQAPLPSC